MPTTVLLVDDHDLIRQGLRRSFELDSAFEVVGEAGTVADALDLAQLLDPDVVVMDIRLPDGSGLDAAATLRSRHATMGIVVLTMYAGDDQLMGALEAGASSFISKSVPATEVLAAAKHAAASPSTFTAAGLAAAMHRRAATDKVRLTDREMQVLELLADGHSVGTLAQTLYISESTIKSHVARIYEKLGAANRAQALMAALRLGVLQSDVRGAPHGVRRNNSSSTRPPGQ